MAALVYQNRRRRFCRILDRPILSVSLPRTPKNHPHLRSALREGSMNRLGGEAGYWVPSGYSVEVRRRISLFHISLQHTHFPFPVADGFREALSIQPRRLGELIHVLRLPIHVIQQPSCVDVPEFEMNGVQLRLLRESKQARILLQRERVGQLDSLERRFGMPLVDANPNVPERTVEKWRGRSREPDTPFVDFKHECSRTAKITDKSIKVADRGVNRLRKVAAILEFRPPLNEKRGIFSFVGNHEVFRSRAVVIRSSKSCACSSVIGARPPGQPHKQRSS